MKSRLFDGSSNSSSLTGEKGEGSQRKRCSPAATSNSYHFHCQVLILEDWFDKNPYPKRAEREELSQVLMVSCHLWKACPDKKILKLAKKGGG